VDAFLLKPEQVAEALGIGKTKTYALILPPTEIRLSGSAVACGCRFESLPWVAEHTKEAET
jgi:hypothetical protein